MPATGRIYPETVLKGGRCPLDLPASRGDFKGGGSPGLFPSPAPHTPT